MQKNKAFALILTILLVIVLIVISTSAIFCVGNVELVWYNTPNKCVEIDKDKILRDSEMKSNENVFILNRNKYINNIEKKDAYVKVLAYEVVWPNNIKIHLMEREDVYAIPVNESETIITDSDFKVLRKQSGQYISTMDNCILVKGIKDIDLTKYHVGDFLPKDNYKDYLNIQDAFLSNDQDLNSFKALIKDIIVDGNNMIMNTFLGVKIDILNSSYYSELKICTALEYLSQLDESMSNHGTIKVFKNKANVIEGIYCE